MKDVILVNLQLQMIISLRDNQDKDDEWSVDFFGNLVGHKDGSQIWTSVRP